MKSSQYWLAAGLLLLGSSVQAQVRAVVGHFASFADSVEGTSVSINVNGATALEGVVFGQFTDYLELGAAGSYTVEIFPTGSTTAAITLTADLADGDYTLLAAGDGANQDLTLLALVDDNTAPAAGNIKLRVVHAAPFADTLEGTNVSIRTAGGDVIGGLSEVPFGVASGYLELPANTYDVKVASPDGNTNFIDPLPVELAAGGIVTVVAAGGSNLPLSIFALPVGELPTRVPVDATAAGTFYDPQIDKQGAQLFALPGQNRLIGFVYTFEADGSQSWYHLDSCNSQPGEDCATPGGFDGVTADVTLYRASGGALADPSAVATLTVAGTATVTFSSCDDVSIDGTFDAAAATFDLTRLTAGYACSAAFDSQ